MLTDFGTIQIQTAERFKYPILLQRSSINTKGEKMNYSDDDDDFDDEDFDSDDEDN